MKFTIPLGATIFATTIYAVPASKFSTRNSAPHVTLSVTNDLTGASASITVPTDGKARMIPDLFRGTAVDQNGAIVATSAQLIAFKADTHCFFQNVNWIINLYGKDKTYVDLDDVTNIAMPINMNEFNLQCNGS